MKENEFESKSIEPERFLLVEAVLVLQKMAIALPQKLANSGGLSANTLLELAMEHLFPPSLFAPLFDALSPIHFLEPKKHLEQEEQQPIKKSHRIVEKDLSLTAKEKLKSTETMGVRNSCNRRALASITHQHSAAAGPFSFCLINFAAKYLNITMFHSLLQHWLILQCNKTAKMLSKINFSLKYGFLKRNLFRLIYCDILILYKCTGIIFDCFQ